MIDHIAFDEEASTLAIRFRNARTYIYSDVPRAIYDALAGAPSAGTYFNRCIRGQFPCRPRHRRYRPA